MSDPFSVASGAVGVISLGLQVCGQIVSYAQAVRGQNDDIQYLATKAEQLRAPLKDLRELIEETKDSSPETANDLKEKTKILRSYVESLEKKVEEAKPVASQSINGKARAGFKKAVYPFKKDALFEIGACLDGMQETLQTTLLTFNTRGMVTLVSGQHTILAEIKTLQLSIESSSPRTILQQPPARIKEWRDKLDDPDWMMTVPRKAQNRRAREITKQYSYYSRWLSYIVTGSFHMSFGSGGLAVAPYLHFRAVHGPESWLANVLKKFHKKETLLIPEKFEVAEFSSGIDQIINQLQEGFLTGKATATDSVSYESYRGINNFPLIEMPHFGDFFFYRKFFPYLIKFIRYMLNCGAAIDCNSENSPIRLICESYILDDEECAIVANIIEKQGPITWIPLTWTQKRNMQNIHLRLDDGIDLPPVQLAILRESEEELQCILETGLVQPGEKIAAQKLQVSLLQLSMGWPKGVQMLLKTAGSIPLLPYRYHNNLGPYPISSHIRDTDTRIEDYITSCKILLDAGYRITVHGTIYVESKRLHLFFLQVIAARRRELLNMAQLFIHPMKLSEFRKDECGLPDSRALDIYEALKAQGVDVDPTLNPGDHKIPPADSTDLTVYGILLQSSQLLEEGYRLGFTDIDRPTLWEFEGGMTPLCWRCDEFRQVSEIDFVLSLLSKGANLFQSLSQMGTKPQSKTTAVHLLNARLAELLSQDDDYHYKELSQFIEDNQSRFWQFLGNHLFSLSHRDSCSCACSAGGCTPLSVSIRLRMDWWDPDEQFFHLSCKMKHFLEFLIDWNQSRPQVSREIIRSLTFDGLGLRHSCCTEIKGGEPFWCTRDESELHDIMDEQKGLIEQLDQLVSEFEAQFDALQLPLMEFLRDIWYHGMMKFHSECDAFDEEHHIEAGRLGISLEVDDGPIPLIVQLLGPGLQELDTTDEEEEEEE